MTAITRFSAVKMAAMIREREISVVELVEAHCREIRRVNDKLDAFVTIDEERALRQATFADDAVAAKAPLGPLHGVPITIKSSIDVAGLACEAGTRLRQGYVAEADAPLVSRLKSAGAIVLGNTTVPEFLMAWETDSAHTTAGRTIRGTWRARPEVQAAVKPPPLHHAARLAALVATTADRFASLRISVASAA